MPRISETRQSQRMREAVQAREQFDSGFKRSRKGNLWRTWEGLNVTVFERPDGYHGYCVSNREGPHFSPGGYDSEEDAIGALWDELNGRNLSCASSHRPGASKRGNV